MKNYYWMLLAVSFMFTPGCQCHIVVNDTTSYIGHKYQQSKILATYTDGKQYYVVFSYLLSERSKTLEISKEMYEAIDKNKVYEFTTDDKSVLTYKVVE